MGASMKRPTATPSDELVRSIIDTVLAGVATTDDGNAWAAQQLRQRGWTCVAPAERMGRKD